MWVAWGLLVVVVDLPLAGWDVLPDLVGYAWVIIGLAGAASVHPAFVRARAAAVVGIPVWAVLGTPLFAAPRFGTLLLTALTVEIVVVTLLVHQLCTGILATAPADDPDSARWARILRVAALVVVSSCSSRSCSPPAGSGSTPWPSWGASSSACSP